MPNLETWDCELTSNLGGVLGIHGEDSRGQGHPRPEGRGRGVCAGEGREQGHGRSPTLSRMRMRWETWYAAGVVISEEARGRGYTGVSEYSQGVGGEGRQTPCQEP